MASSSALQPAALATAAAPSHSEQPMVAQHQSLLAESAATPPSQTNNNTQTVYTASMYIHDHFGFVMAGLTVLLAPAIIFLGCCFARRCRRAAKQRAAEKKKAPLPQLQPAIIGSHDAPLLASTTRQQQRTPPVSVNRSLLPVDAYHGVPPKQFVL